MGNRLTRKKKAVAVSTEEGDVVALSSKQLDLPLTSLSARKDEALPDRNYVEQPLSARQAPLTARDGDHNNKEDPVEFFRRCYELEEDPFTLYTQSLVLKNQRQFAAASGLLRCLVANPKLTLEAQHHLAQCLIAQDPALNWCAKEATRCLEVVVEVTKSLSNDADVHYSMMYRESLELLAYVMIAGKRFDRALQLLEALVALQILLAVELKFA